MRLAACEEADSRTYRGNIDSEWLANVLRTLKTQERKMTFWAPGGE